MKLKILLFLFISQVFISAQENDALKYFPHKTGDMWEYSYSDGPYFGTLQNFNIKDSTDSEGNIYITQSARFINPIESPVLLNNLITYKIDTINNFVYGAMDQASNALLYKLNANLGDKWVIWDYQSSNGFEMVRVNEIKEVTLFGIPTILKGYVFYFAFDSTDTTGLVRKSDFLAKGFGLFSKGGGDLFGRIYLTGAVIDGILYGDTTDIITSIDDLFSPLPDDFKLFQNYPNPFNPSTKIVYSLPNDGYVRLSVFNLLGMELRTLVNREQKAGNYEIVFNGTGLASGIYIYVLKNNKKIISKKMLLLK
ncbi:MAG: T9SS type A sorting domain-containing protein [Bacteroidetes bacterium]|nr:T9SS type A sorting domain-containing protein [Bacteroidota bacterium]